MKKPLLLLNLIFALFWQSICFATDWCADGNLEAGYYMNEASGNLDDCSSNDNAMAPTGSPGTYNTTGQFGGAFDFTEGVNAGFSSTDIAAMTNIRTLSVGAWTAPDTDGANDATVCNGGLIFSKYDGADGWNFGIENDAAPVEFCFQYQWTGGTQRWLTTTDPVAFTPVWQHLAVTYDAGLAANDPIFYYNGVSQALTQTNTATGSPDDDTGGEPTIGVRGDGTGTGTAGEYDGDIDEVFVYNGILTSTQINDIKDNGLTPAVTSKFPTPDLWWHQRYG